MGSGFRFNHEITALQLSWVPDPPGSLKLNSISVPGGRSAWLSTNIPPPGEFRLLRGVRITDDKHWGCSQLGIFFDPLAAINSSGRRQRKGIVDLKGDCPVVCQPPTPNPQPPVFRLSRLNLHLRRKLYWGNARTTEQSGPAQCSEKRLVDQNQDASNSRRLRQTAHRWPGRGAYHQ